jgi:lysophospholipase L1-like esterase
MMVRICVFGDSICSEEEYLGFPNWVALLRKELSKQDKENSVFNLGISGEDTSGLLKRIEVECEARNPDIIIIRTGDNDSRFTNINQDSVKIKPDQFKKNVSKIIKTSKKFSKKIIWVGNAPCIESKTTPTIWSEKEYFTNKSIKNYNEMIREICKKDKVIFIELFDSWSKLNLNKIIDQFDGLHPNAEGHRLIYEEVLKVLPKTI